MMFPKLFKKTSTGAQQEWQVSVVKNAIHTTWGQTDGALQTSVDVIKEGKNLGKKNETTPDQQAELEAQALWEKKKKKGYVEDPSSAMRGEVDVILEGSISPMLAHRFDEQGHKIVYPAFVQPKFDGHRCIAIVMFGQCTLWTRTRKPITGAPHIQRAMESLENGTYDGELYNHDYRDKFEELTSFIRQEIPKPGHEVVQFHIYDLVNKRPFDERLSQLRSMDLGKDSPLRHVRTIQVNDEDDLMLAFNSFLSEGYEGAMVRNASGLYVNKRSYDLQKVKEFSDTEFKIVGVEEGRGKLTGHAIFVCSVDESSTSLTFSAKMKGETANLKEYFDHPERAIGRWLTVKFQGLTKNGIPRFPVAERFKEDV